jgi:hypothetical protein
VISSKRGAGNLVGVLCSDQMARPTGVLLLAWWVAAAGCLVEPDRSLLDRDGGPADRSVVEGSVRDIGPDGPVPDAPPPPDGFKADVVGPSGATPVYRSVGPSNTQPLSQGAASKTLLTVAGPLATFSAAQPDRVGVGDVVQYDVNGDGIISEKDAVAIIHRRYSKTQFAVRTATAGVPTSVLGGATWSIYRAYTSLADAVTGKENIGIQSTLRDFDSWSGGRDLVTGKLTWNVACYADAPENKPVVISGWLTSSTHRLRIFAPVGPQLVGTSQRHTGKAGGGFVIRTRKASHAVEIASDNVTLEGLEISEWVNDGDNTSFEGVAVRAGGVMLADLIVHDEDYSGVANPNGDAINLNGMKSGDKVTIRNCAIYKVSRGAINYQGSEAVEVVVESCSIDQTGLTLVQADAEGGISVKGTAAKVTVVNTISVGSGGGKDFKSASGWGSSSNNVSSDDSAPGTDSLKWKKPVDLFESSGADLHLKSGAPALNKGKDLSSRFTNDIDGETRKDPWDIGADER